MTNKKRKEQGEKKSMSKKSRALYAFIAGTGDRTRLNRRQIEEDPYNKIIRQLQEYVNNREPVIVTERGSAGTYVVHLDYIGDKWCKGTIKCYGGLTKSTIPYTVMYSDILTSHIRIRGAESVDDTEEENL